MNPQYEILRNGELFAYTREPFGEFDGEFCRTFIDWLKSGKLCVGGGNAQICNLGFGEMDILDAFEFVEPVGNMHFVMAHPSVLTLRPSEHEWTFQKKQH